MRSEVLIRQFFVIVWLAAQPDSYCLEPKVIFSQERGFYYSSFELTLYAGSGDCNIFYTLDGSDPRFAVNAIHITSPVVIPINPYLNEGRAVTPGVIIRACSVCDNDTSEVETHSYIFPSEVKYQSEVSPDLVPYWPGERYVPNTYPPTLIDWMRIDYQVIDLGADPEVISKDEYFWDFENALLDIPTLSLVTDPASLFDPLTGIYINSTWSGMDWERPGSIELIDPSTDGFQSNTGIRIRGGWSCRGDFPKHAFRLFFRDEYGNRKLDYPLFEDEGTDKFDKIDLRCDQNNSWHLPGGNPDADFVHELFARDIQGDMEQPYTRSRYYHLFLNGKYWGLFQTQERPEASFAETYLGGSKEDYDVVKSSGPSYDYPPYTLEATNGDLNSSYEFWQIAKEGFTPENYNKVKGLNPDGSPNPDYKIYLDEENLIDYMIGIFYSGNYDGPAEIGTGVRINNFFGIFNRENPDGFKYFLHDVESSFYDYNDNTVNLVTGAGEDFSGFNPRWLHQRLLVNEEYRQKLADRAYKYLFNNGTLTVDQNIERFRARVDQCEEAVIGESARWGDASSTVPYTREGTWEPVIQRFYETYFPHRTDVLIDQFTEMGWFNGIQPPAFDENDFEIDNESGILTDDGTFKLINPNSTGEIYYTLNAVDPRVTGGSISAEALLYSGEIEVNQTVFLKTRIKDRDNWSPLAERVILTNPGLNLRISEISYNPKGQIIDEDTLPSKNLEFVEIKNNYTTDLDLSGYILSGGISYTFPLNTLLEVDSLVVIASDSMRFKKLYGFKPFGQFSGNLNNAGEELILLNPCRVKRAEVEYNTDGVWYKATDGAGFTLVYADYEINQYGGTKEHWRVSTNWLGSPGKDDPAPDSIKLEISEVLANSDYPNTDAVEFYNPSTIGINIGGWYLSDDKDNPAKWRIPDDIVISAEGYLVLYEGHYEETTMHYDPDEFGEAFALSSAGEDVYLCSSDPFGNPQHFVCEYAIEATDRNTTFGVFTNSVDELNHVLLNTITLGFENGSFKASPIIFKTIMYHPVGNNYEFIILKNRTDSVVNLYLESDSSVSWKVDGINFDFPANISIDSADSVYLVEKRVSTDAFRDVMNIDPEVHIFNFNGKLKNSSEIISVMKPIVYENDTIDPYAWVNLEKVEYNDETPWPSIADGDGYALQRKDEQALADDYTNWKTIYSALPDAVAGNDKRVRINAMGYLNGSESDDPQGNPLTYQWNLIEKPSTSNSLLSDETLMMPHITPDRVGTYRFSLQVSNGETQSAPSFVSMYAYENRIPIALTQISRVRVNVNQTAVLDGSRSYDPDYENLYYEWDIYEQPEGSTAIIQLSDLETTTLIPDMEGSYHLYLTVNDGELYSVPWHVEVIASPATITPEISITDNVLVYPNPTSDNVAVEFYLANSSAINLSVSDIEGREIYTQTYSNLTSGSQHFDISMNELNVKPGMYILRIQSDEITISRKILYTK